MKINEIINEAGFLDKLIKVGGAAMTGVQTAVKSNQIGQIADLSSKTWIKALSKAEAQNNYQPLESKLSGYLKNWIDQTLLGTLSLSSADAELKTAVNQAVSKISQQPRNRNIAANEFEKILNLSIASGKQIATTMTQQQKEKQIIAFATKVAQNDRTNNPDLQKIKQLAGV